MQLANLGSIRFSSARATMHILYLCWPSHQAVLLLQSQFSEEKLIQDLF